MDGDPSNINELETKIKYDNSVIRHLVLKTDIVNESDSFLTQDTKAKKRAEERAHEAKLKAQVQQQPKPAPVKLKRMRVHLKKKKMKAIRVKRKVLLKRKQLQKKLNLKMKEQA